MKELEMYQEYLRECEECSRKPLPMDDFMDYVLQAGTLSILIEQAPYPEDKAALSQKLKRLQEQYFYSHPIYIDFSK